MYILLEIDNIIGSVVIEILSFRQKPLLLYMMGYMSYLALPTNYQTKQVAYWMLFGKG